MTNMAVTNTSSPVIATLKTTVLIKGTSETQEKYSVTVLQTLATISTRAKPPHPHYSTVT